VRSPEARDEPTERATTARRRPAFYAMRPGGWRDYVTLLHPPYTIWHLSYVVLGASVAPRVNGVHVAAAVVGFFLGVGISAHAFDELAGRPLRTGMSDGVLRVLGWSGLVLAAALGVAGAARVSWWLLAFVAAGVFFVLAYNLEAWGGRFHSDLWFAVTWGGFPALVGEFAQDGRLSWPIVPVTTACVLLSVAQRRLSTPVRRLRRTVARVEGRVVLPDGREEALDERALRAAPEAALRAMWPAVALLAGGAVWFRLTG
jgi:hypothetical protein